MHPRFLHEMDYAREATNAVTWSAQMAAAGVDGITVAQPVPELCSGYVLTTEWIEGESQAWAAFSFLPLHPTPC